MRCSAQIQQTSGRSCPYALRGTRSCRVVGRPFQSYCRTSLPRTRAASTSHRFRSHSNDLRKLFVVHSAAESTGQEPRIVVEGDIVSVHFVCKTPEGQILESTRESTEPLTFEVGVSDTVGNPLYQAIDASVRGLAVGDKTEIEATGGPWQQELVFDVPIDHPEIQRLEGRYKNQGGLIVGNIVELSNNKTALVVKKTEEGVTLDANSMFAGRNLLFELEIVGIDDAPAFEEEPAV